MNWNCALQEWFPGLGTCRNYHWPSLEVGNDPSLPHGRLPHLLCGKSLCLPSQQKITAVVSLLGPIKHSLMLPCIMSNHDPSITSLWETAISSVMLTTHLAL